MALGAYAFFFFFFFFENMLLKVESYLASVLYYVESTEFLDPRIRNRVGYSILQGHCHGTQVPPFYV